MLFLFFLFCKITDSAIFDFSTKKVFFFFFPNNKHKENRTQTRYHNSDKLTAVGNFKKILHITGYDRLKYQNET